jgi:hypothetical protein
MFKVKLAAFYRACGVTPPNSENAADAAGEVELKDGTDLANLCRRSGVPKGATVTLTFPDVCIVPAPPAGPVPIPYPNAVLNGINDQLGKGGFPKIKIRDASQRSEFAKTAGDEAGTQKGVVSSTNMGKTTHMSFSVDVKAEGKNVTRFGDVRTTSFR